jgi:hypothetical protein
MRVIYHYIKQKKRGTSAPVNKKDTNTHIHTNTPHTTTTKITIMTNINRFMSYNNYLIRIISRRDFTIGYLNLYEYLLIRHCEIFIFIKTIV